MLDADVAVIGRLGAHMRDDDGLSVLVKFDSAELRLVLPPPFRALYPAVARDELGRIFRECEDHPVELVELIIYQFLRFCPLHHGRPEGFIENEVDDSVLASEVLSNRDVLFPILLVESIEILTAPDLEVFYAARFELTEVVFPLILPVGKTDDAVVLWFFFFHTVGPLLKFYPAPHGLSMWQTVLRAL